MSRQESSRFYKEVRFIDFNTHYGIKLYGYFKKEIKLKEDNIEINKIVLNPAYKYSCECCVDGFYQQYLWSKDKAFALRLGIYNPKCRISPQVEIPRQFEKGIVGIVLHPTHHGFSLLHNKLQYVYEFIDKNKLILVVHNAVKEEIEYLLDKYNFNVVLIDSNFVINDKRVYYVVNHQSRYIPPRAIYGSNSPYNSLDLIESAREYLRNHEYDEDIGYKNFLRLIYEANA